MHFLKEIPVHEMQKLRKEEKKRRVKEGKKKGKRKQIRVWKVSLNIPSYTVEWRGTERRGALAQVSVKHRCKPV